MNTKLSCCCLALAAALIAACAPGEEAPPPTAEAPAEAPQAAAGTAAVSGTVTYADGDPDTPIRMDADPVCQSLHADPVHTQKIVTDDQDHLANVFVYVKEGLQGKSFPAPSESKVLDQKGCQYQPHVSGIQVGQKLVIRNSDPTLHNIHALPQSNEEFNQGQPFEGMESERTFSQVEVMVPFKCDVHPWMRSYMGVLDHPFYAVSSESGGFTIDELPAGTYTLEAWHEELGTKTQSVTVGDGETVEVSFDFSPGGGEAAAPAPSAG